MQRFKVSTVRLIDVEDEGKTAEDVRQALIAQGTEEGSAGSTQQIETADGITLEFSESELLDVTVQKV